MAAPLLSPDRAVGNLVEVTVGELSGALKRTIEDRFGLVRVRGEISNFRGPHSSGHAYFCLKDDAARIDAVIWKTTYLRLRIKPQEGLEVIATGRVTTFPGKSSYQIVIDAIEPAGIGALMALLEQRRISLAAEGLFAASRKQRLPFLPRSVGVITSPTGAVIRDILHRIHDRFPSHVMVWPVRVQGETAADEVAAAIAGFNALPERVASRNGELVRPDVLIVARGGGSLEDLWAFNEEIVVRAVANGTIPLVSAIGHETDTTLIDFAADLRAPTPTGAAEKVLPVRTDLQAALADVARRHRAAVRRCHNSKADALRALARALPGAGSVVAAPQQRLGHATERLNSAAASCLNRRHLDLSRLAHRLSRQAPRTRLAQRQSDLDRLDQRLLFGLERNAERRHRVFTQLDQRLLSYGRHLGRLTADHRGRNTVFELALRSGWAKLLADRRNKAEQCGKLLETLGYRQVLSRGFALVRDSNGQPLRSARTTPSATLLDIEFADGHLDVMTTGSRPLRRSRSRVALSQGDLF